MLRVRISLRGNGCAGVKGSVRRKSLMVVCVVSFESLMKLRCVCKFLALDQIVLGLIKIF